MGTCTLALSALASSPPIPAALLESLELSVPLFPDVGADVKLLHLSDLHASALVRLDYLGRAFDLALKWQPDLICVTGDFVTEKFKHIDEYASLLQRLSRAAPTFACLGNHDGGAWAKPRRGYEDNTVIAGMLREAGINLLQNEAVSRTFHGRRLRLVGVGDVWAVECNPERAFTSEPTGRLPTVLLSHNPDSKDLLRRFTWDLMLAGHTHGGEVELPFLGQPFVPVVDKRFVRGLHRWEGRWLHVSKGIGSLHGIRVNCPGDVTLLRLVGREDAAERP